MLSFEIKSHTFNIFSFQYLKSFIMLTLYRTILLNFLTYLLLYRSRAVMNRESADLNWDIKKSFHWNCGNIPLHLKLYSSFDWWIWLLKGDIFDFLPINIKSLKFVRVNVPSTLLTATMCECLHIQFCFTKVPWTLGKAIHMQTPMWGGCLLFCSQFSETGFWVILNIKDYFHHRPFRTW